MIERTPSNLLDVLQKFDSKFLIMSDFNNESVAAMETTLNDVDRALERLRVGTYRTCQACNTSLDDAELIANPPSQLPGAPRARLSLRPF